MSAASGPPDLGLPPSLDEFEALARRAYLQMPRRIRELIAELPIRVLEFPEPETLAELALESPYDLLGLYHGIGLSQRDGGHIVENVDTIFLYRRPILDYWRHSEASLEAIVRHVLIHEIGHHFGLSDADMERIEDGKADDVS